MKKYTKPCLEICILNEENIIITSLTGVEKPGTNEGAGSDDMGF